MPNAPKRHQPHYRDLKAERRAVDRLRGSAASRGYGTRWNAYSRQLCEERVFCELCITIGIETSIVRAPAGEAGGKIISVVDHTIPASGPDDPLFWESLNHRCLCVPCHTWKSRKFDGAYGNPVKACGHSADTIEHRWAEIVREFAVERGQWRGW